MIAQNLDRVLDRNLEMMVSEDRFRHDLYYRLNVLPIHLSPLRERTDDIKPLTRHFVAKCSKNVGKNFKDISLDSLEMLQSHSWPGNIRELENIIERAVIFSKEPTLTLESSALLKHNTLIHIYCCINISRYGEFCLKNVNLSALDSINLRGLCQLSCQHI